MEEAVEANVRHTIDCLLKYSSGIQEKAREASGRLPSASGGFESFWTALLASSDVLLGLESDGMFWNEVSVG